MDGTAWDHGTRRIDQLKCMALRKLDGQQGRETEAERKIFNVLSSNALRQIQGLPQTPRMGRKWIDEAHLSRSATLCPKTRQNVAETNVGKMGPRFFQFSSCQPTWGLMKCWPTKAMQVVYPIRKAELCFPAGDGPNLYTCPDLYTKHLKIILTVSMADKLLATGLDEIEKE